MFATSGTKVRSLGWPLMVMLALWMTGSQVSGQGSGPLVYRKPAVAGSFYPAGKEALESLLSQLFEKAVPKKIDGEVRCLIVPHAGYVFSGIVAASGYASIPADASYKNIFILGTSHREQFSGASVYSVGNYLTPLGEVRVNREIANALIENNKGIRYLPAAHDREHSIEVQLPYLQSHFDELPPIIPIVMGSSSMEAARDLAVALHPYFNEENLFIVSSDFSHYPDYEAAQRIDHMTGEAILQNDPELFYNTLRKNSRESIPNLVTSTCGWSSILTLLYLTSAEDEMSFTPILYRNSGDSPSGEKDRVVGYWAIAASSPDPGTQPFFLSEGDRRALLELSRNTLESYINQGVAPVIDEKALPTMLRRNAGAFVSLYMGGRLRGCIGNFSTTEPLCEVVRQMTVAAATRDPRFVPVESPELSYIEIEISVLTPLQRIHSIEEFQPGKHGIYMTRDGKSGTYLPQVADETGWSREELLGHCARDKAGIGWDGWKNADLYVYEAIVFGEEKKE